VALVEFRGLFPPGMMTGGCGLFTSSGLWVKGEEGGYGVSGRGLSFPFGS
jgi:hypothetical protein